MSPHFTPPQLKSLKRASQIAAETFRQIKKLIRPGWTEKQVASKINQIMKALGAQGLAFRTIVAAGSHSSRVHHKNTTRKIRKNDIVLFDFGCKVESVKDTSEVAPAHGGTTPRRWRKKDKIYFCSDFSRTIFIGQPKPEWQKVYRIVKSSQQKAIKFLNTKYSSLNTNSIKASIITPLRCITDCTFGIGASELDAIARDCIIKKGYGKYFTHGLGHGIGNRIHQYFRINAKSRIYLKPGFVFTIEPGIYLKGRFGVRIEDVIYLSPKGLRILTTCPQKP